MIFSLIYFSKAIHLMKEEELRFLLGQSRETNEKLDITGLLLYIEGRFLSNKEGRFMQLLEGREDLVRQIFTKIKSDNRHHQIIVLWEQFEEGRAFKDWSMGFKSLQLDHNKDIRNFFQLDEYNLQQREHPHRDVVMNFFKSFYNINQMYDY